MRNRKRLWLITAGLVALGSQPAAADPGAPAPAAKTACRTLDKLQESIDDDLDAGLGGLRIVWNRSPFDTARLSNSRDKIQIFSHGVRYLRGIDDETPVPGLAPVLSRLESSAQDLRDSVDSLAYHVEGSYTPGYDQYSGSWSPGYDSLHNPAEGDWAALDYADEQEQALVDLVEKLRANGCA
ncbi:MAG: hypothetical protein ACRC20_12435 [Segniliparus sp.]|uniref:hypothetical protein n=1 Tax=Segniliparus sp. TaxID=2804064 RepID=UPI003F30B31A